MFQDIINMAKEVQKLTPDEVNKEIQATRIDMEQVKLIKMNVQKEIIYPTHIQLGTYIEGNVRRIKFNKDNPRHINLFHKFYGIKKPNDGNEN